MSPARTNKTDGVTIPNQARFEAPSLDEIKKRAKDKSQKKPPISVDAQGDVNTSGSGTKVPKGTFHI